ncbi:hypothetical protein HGP16_27715 [Rhizobium sp. P40RR-XXII]|uniref:hypothetical protein n=1 Tax=Rhizobium sp. P40RR-XXII TaxID=2726739 RepID=UPI001456CCF8|nr:hypothetical protein [Rhizobium sp. P40RR-XXII]NLS20322.1 hypothetical protein [Rhizobium sp. P40RR-XXII]
MQAFPLDPSIRFIIPVPDGEPEKASPFQGFAVSLCLNSRLMRLAAKLPSNVFDLSEDGRKTFAARRMCGVNPIYVLPMSPGAIRSLEPEVFAPFNVLLLPDDQHADDYRDWANACAIAPLLVAKSGGDVRPADLSPEALRAFCLAVCDLLSEQVIAQDIDDARCALHDRFEPVSRQLDYGLEGHATITPNLMVLHALGYRDIGVKPFKDIGNGIAPYVRQIVATCETIFSERGSIDTSGGSHEYPHFPDLNLFAPAMYAHVATMRAPDKVVGAEKRAFFTVRDMLVGQTGYGFSATTVHQEEVMFGASLADIGAGKAKASPHPMMHIRQLELALATDAVATFAASHLAATIRLPNAVNTTFKSVRAFASGRRGDETHSKKRLDAFRQVQQAIDSAVPAGFLSIIRQSRDGIRIIADAHLEWLSVDGLPLCIRKNVSRLPATPGNLLIDQLAPLPLLRLTPESFRKVLIISALKRTDPIRPMFEMAFEGFSEQWEDRIEIEVVEVTSADELVDALNAFDGPLVIFDGHGSHREEKAGTLHLYDEACDVWLLRGRIHRPPPIVILSACDTHAAARNHATTANGFLAIGSRAVLGSVFPIGGRDAAILAARLIFRISHFLPAAISVFGRALSWTEVISGMLRMQLLTDFLRLLEQEKLIDQEAYFHIHMEGNLAINGGAPSPFEDVIDLLETAGLSREGAKAKLDMALANSDVLSYVNIGRPETILIDSRDRDETDDQS